MIFYEYFDTKSISTKNVRANIAILKLIINNVNK